MDSQKEQLNALIKYLGEPTTKKDSNSAFYCPFCNHHKKKLEIDLETGLWNCWVCHTKGRGVSYLLKKLNADRNDIRNIRPYEKYNTKNFNIKEEVLILPKGYVELKDGIDTALGDKCIKYLNSRGINYNDIVKYKIGYISFGDNIGNIVIPSYSSTGYLNYYVLKNIITGRYINPKHPKTQVFLDIFINWDKPIVIVEGMFDAMAVRDNALPLLGKIMNRRIKNKILRSKSDTFYICLDGDAKDSIISMSKYLLSIGKKVFTVELPNDQDPSSLGYTKVWEMINQSKQISERDVLYGSLLESL